MFRLDEREIDNAPLSNHHALPRYDESAHDDTDMVPLARDMPSRDRRGAYRPSRSRSRERDRLRGRGYDRPARDRDRDRAARPAYRYAAPRELEPGEEPRVKSFENL